MRNLVRINNRQNPQISPRPLKIIIKRSKPKTKRLLNKEQLNYPSQPTEEQPIAATSKLPEKQNTCKNSERVEKVIEIIAKTKNNQTVEPTPPPLRRSTRIRRSVLRESDFFEMLNTHYSSY